MKGMGNVYRGGNVLRSTGKGEGLIFFQIILSCGPKVIHDPNVIFRWDETREDEK